MIRKVTQLRWKQFLATEYGVEGMLHLRERSPSIQKGAPHEMHFDAGYAMGYARALDVINDIIASEPDKEVKISND